MKEILQKMALLSSEQIPILQWVVEDLFIRDGKGFEQAHMGSFTDKQQIPNQQSANGLPTCEVG